jgi:Reverse transcriptase (RNA-dependent DNA polymerase)
VRSPSNAHFRRTAKLARALKRADVYEWLVAQGYFPEPYVLPPCFTVSKHPSFKAGPYFSHTAESFKPKVTEYLQVHFPKTELTDRTFGIVDPEIHSDIARTIARNWKTLVTCLFRLRNKVSAYSFPIPLDSNAPGSIGRLRSGRMIYEFIEMTENDLAAVAYRYKYVFKTDVKNFYPSLYTHSIAWAIHGKRWIRQGSNRYNYNLVGNRLDKLFQNANDGCTNGIPIGPAVSDLISEIVLAGVDASLSRRLNDDVLVVRFKDDYRILAVTEEEGKTAVKALQAALKEYRLELSDAKTEGTCLPEGLFRDWVSQYHAANPRPKSAYTFKRFKETCLSVLRIDRDNKDCGVIDRFLADIVTKRQRLRINLGRRALPQVVSLLLMLAAHRTKAFPKVLAIIELALKSPNGKRYSAEIVAHLVTRLSRLCGSEEKEAENRYQAAWICYFLRTNGFDRQLRQANFKFRDPVVRAISTSRFNHFKACSDFKVFRGVKAAGKKISMFEHLDVFKPQ